MNTREHFIYKFFIFVFLFLFSTMSSIAAENALNGIDVKQINDGSYKIFLKLDKSAKILKQQEENDNLTVLINKTLPSDSLEIVYDNAENLNNIIVQKKNSNNTVILFQGKNIKNSVIYTKDFSTGITQKVDEKTNFLSNFFFISDKKFVFGSIIILFMTFISALIIRPKEKRYYTERNDRMIKSKQYYAVNTLRTKNMLQSKNIPSINYRINGSFNNARMQYASVPKDMVKLNSYKSDNKEQIRKVG